MYPAGLPALPAACLSPRQARQTGQAGGRQGSFAPRKLLRFVATMCPADSHAGPILGYWFPKIVATPDILPDAASCWVSQVPTASFRTRPPFPPRGALHLPAACLSCLPAGRRQTGQAGVLLLVASLQVPGFAQSGRLATPTLRNEANSGSLALGLMRSQLGTVHPFASTMTVETGPLPVVGYPSTRGRRYMANEQLPWLIPFNQQDASGFAWRT